MSRPAPNSPLFQLTLVYMFRRAKTAAPMRRGARVVDRDGLENRCACKRTVGSNPTLSASKSVIITACFESLPSLSDISAGYGYGVPESEF